MAVFSSDSFTGTAGTELSAYSANWVQRAGTVVLTDANRARQSGTVGGVYHNDSTAPASADYSVFITARAFTLVTNAAVGAAGRMSTSALTYYYARAQYSLGWQLYKRVAGTITQLGSSVSKTWSTATDYIVELRMTGTTIELYGEGSPTVVISQTDSAISAAGYPGVVTASGTGPTNTTNWHLDSFSAEQSGAAYTLEVTPGSYALTGSSAQTLAARLLEPSPGGYALTGASVELVYTTGGLNNYVLEVTPGSYALTGSNASTLVARYVDVTPGVHVLSGADGTLLREYRADVQPGAYALTGSSATLTYSGAAGGYPDPADVREGVQYGPNGNDFTGTLAAVRAAYLRRR